MSGMTTPSRRHTSRTWSADTPSSGRSSRNISFANDTGLNTSEVSVSRNPSTATFPIKSINNSLNQTLDSRKAPHDLTNPGPRTHVCNCHIAPHDKCRTVIVYGFPLEQTGVVLTAFQKYGEIVGRQSGRGNWMTITYRDTTQAQIALSRNGSRIGDLIIGVKWDRQSTQSSDAIQMDESRSRPIMPNARGTLTMDHSAPRMYPSSWRLFMGHLLNW